MVVVGLCFRFAVEEHVLVGHLIALIGVDAEALRVFVDGLIEISPLDDIWGTFGLHGEILVLHVVQGSLEEQRYGEQPLLSIDHVVPAIVIWLICKHHGAKEVGDEIVFVSAARLLNPEHIAP